MIETLPDCENANCNNKVRLAKNGCGYTRFCSRKCSNLFNLQKGAASLKVSQFNLEKLQYEFDRTENYDPVCEYHGCNLRAVIYFKLADKWCCNESVHSCPGVKSKKKSTIKNIYSVDNISQSPDIKKQKVETCLLNYGVTNPIKSTIVKDKIKETSQAVYGVDNPSQSLIVKEKRNNTFSINYESGHPLKDTVVIQKRKDTMIEIYGVDNYGKTQEHSNNMSNYFSELSKTDIDLRSNKIIQTKYKRGLITDPSLKNDFERYWLDVRQLSERNYKKYKSIINPENIKRGRTSYHLDHIFSIKESFENNVPIEVVSHWSNLRIIESNKNIKKKEKSDKTIKELFEDFLQG